jgi:selenide,water dikinase
MVSVSARSATDITGFGLLGHLFEMVSASGVAAELEFGAIPFLPGALDYARDGVNTGGGRSNQSYLGERVSFDTEIPEDARVACFDPQTSGGLLIAVHADRADALRAALEREGVAIRAEIGRITSGTPGTVHVRLS